MKLTIVIPAYNEEGAIASIVERTLTARETIVRESPASHVDIIVVNDGSTDRTGTIAASYPSIRTIEFKKNRGYGAAIKAGFAQSDSELVGFLDADGTCDPEFFAPLCRALCEENAAVALGSRMGPHSRMPWVRRLGNRIYAMTLSLLSNRAVTDTASGMRVIRREALPKLYPLPDGLHFTPAMSARVLMDDRLTLVERPMSYEERVGESKLHVVSDGLRFFHTIFEMTLMWRPARVFTAAAVLCLSIMTLLAMHPIEMWLRLGRLNEDVIYRLLFCFLMGAVGVTLLSAGVVCRILQRLLADAPADERAPSFIGFALDRMYTARGLVLATAVSLPVLVWLVGPGLWTRMTLGHVDQHWSRAVLAGLIAFGLIQMIASVLIANLLRFHVARGAATTSTDRSAVDLLPPASESDVPGITTETAEAALVGLAGRSVTITTTSLALEKAPTKAASREVPVSTV